MDGSMLDQSSAADAGQHVQAVAVQGQHPVVVEKAAVEVDDLARRRTSRRWPCAEKLAQLGRQRRRAGAAALRTRWVNRSVRQQADVLGKEAKEQADQKVGRAPGVGAVAAQQVGQAGELGGGGLRDLLGGLRGAKALRLEKDGAQLGQALGREQVVQGGDSTRLTVLVKLVWTTMRSMSQTTSSGGLSSDSRYWSSCW